MSPSPDSDQRGTQTSHYKDLDFIDYWSTEREEGLEVGGVGKGRAVQTGPLQTVTVPEEDLVSGVTVGDEL